LPFIFLEKGSPVNKAGPLIEPLTRREQEILTLLAAGHTNKEIAASLNLSLNSVKWYARQIYGKLGIENRLQLPSRARELGLISDGPIAGTTPSPSTGSEPYSSTILPGKPTHNLPIQLTTFVGRELEIEQIRKHLATARLVTLTGTGGVGKTRLALEIGSQVLSEYIDGVWLVELAPLGDPEVIPVTIASIFGVRADQNRPLLTALLDFLREKQLLLILDNCEHLVEACAELADAILRACPHVRILASTREALGIEGELPYYVPSLPFPPPGKPSSIEQLAGYEAIRLFLERARLILPDFTVTEANASSLVSICSRLDGIPLALELAAARLQVLSLEHIATRLDDRFRLLTGGSRRALPRHQTLQALIDWSYELLTSEERALFRRLSVFAGDWTLEAADCVCARSGQPGSDSFRAATVLPSIEILDLLTGLTSKSLITVERDGDVVNCYRMLETIRQYAQEKLLEAGEAEQLRDRHLEYFLGLADQSEPLLRGPAIIDRLELLDSQIDNLRLALGWAFGGKRTAQIAQGVRLASALGFYWYARSLIDEGVKYLKYGLDVIPFEDQSLVHIRASAWFVVGFLVVSTLDFTRIDEIRPGVEESISLFKQSGDSLGEALSQCELGLCLMSKYITSLGASVERSEFPHAHSLGEQGLATCRELGKSPDLALALMMNMLIDSLGLDLLNARKFGEEALELCELSGDKMIVGLILLRLGAIALSQGDIPAAQRYVQKSLRLSQELKDKIGIMSAYTGLGQIAYFCQDFEGMEAHFLASLALSRETGELIYQMFSLRNLGIAALRQGCLDRSLQYYDENLSLAQKVDWVENDWAKYDVITFILGMAGIALLASNISFAARLLGTVEAHIACFYKPLDNWDQAEFDRISREVRLQLDPTTCEAALSAGRQLTLEAAVSEARRVSPSR
jgi:predicted ATPase/DNA-binding CsgD family transcriptional regulator